jgi:hypothetical protein
MLRFSPTALIEARERFKSGTLDATALRATLQALQPGTTDAFGRRRR